MKAGSESLAANDCSSHGSADKLVRESVVEVMWASILPDIVSSWISTTKPSTIESRSVWCFD